MEEIKMKKCSKCGRELSVGAFRSKNGAKVNKDGLNNTCKECEKQYRIDTRAQRTKYENDKRANDIEYDLRARMVSLINRFVDKSVKDRDCIKYIGCSISELKIYLEGLFHSHEYTDEIMDWSSFNRNGWHIENIVQLSLFDKTNNNDCLKAWHYTNLKPKWRLNSADKNKERKVCENCFIKLDVAMFSKNNDRGDGYSNWCKACVAKYDKIYKKEILTTNIHCRLALALRSRLFKAIRGNFKSGSAINDLGCSIQDFKQYMEKLFQPGMNWKNWALYGWHIDHIIPLSSFNLENRKELLKACHYTNLQPLWAFDNLSKGSKIIKKNDNEEE